MGPTMLSIVMIGLEGLAVLVLMALVPTFGRLANRVIVSNAKTRIECKESAAYCDESERRLLAIERRIADVQMAQIELVREMMKAHRESA